MVLLGVILRFALFGFGFVCSVGFLLIGRGKVARVYRLLEHVAAGCPGHGPVHLLVDSAAEIGFLWSPEMVGWAGIEQLGRSNSALSGRMVKGVRFLLTSVLERVFVEVLGWMLTVLCSSLTLTMFGRER